MSTSAPTPDFQGFAAAQETLRQEFGRDVRFYSPSAMLYDPSTPASAFDDEGIPLDPLVGASAVASAGVAVPDLTYTGSAQCNVVFRPLQTSIMRRDESFESPIAIRSGLNKDLILHAADYARASGATYYEIGTLARDDTGAIIYPEVWTPEDGELWKIVNLKHDAFGSVERVIVYGQGTL